MPLDHSAADLVDRVWTEIVPVLHDYIEIPNVSEAFDPDWREHGCPTSRSDPAGTPRSWRPGSNPALERASTAAFGQGARLFGEGGSIPFMGMLGQRFPAAQFVITGALGPDANAHGPNEYLHLPTARRLTHAVAEPLDAHARRG